MSLFQHVLGSVPLYDTSNINNRYDGHNNPSAPNTGGYNPNAPSAPRNEGSIYPNLGGSGSNYGQNGYRPQGGYPNTGYQQPGGYNGYQQPGYGGYNPNSRPTGYGQQNTYGSNGYNQGQNRPQQGVPDGYYVAGAGYQQPASGGYGSNNNKYHNPGYGYNQGNQGYGAYGNAGYGNNGYGQNAYGQNRRGQGNSAGTTITDSIKDALKKIGSDFLQKAVSGALKKN
ncbi:hypothetical protein HHI36_014973 [Cryptolaemus montrouzieri]|uniref:Prion protein n=1 Tax=Cryptolaemus montrouzieri TaxID=559131 RepID=A0ABD2N4C0_9CUCU